jgi:hypothetical protein
MNLWLQDLRYALRTLRRNAMLSVVILVSLGIGIGANSAIFSVVDALLLRPLPYPHSDRLAAVWLHSPGIGVLRDCVRRTSTSSGCSRPVSVNVRLCQAASGLHFKPLLRAPKKIPEGTVSRVDGSFDLLSGLLIGCNAVGCPRQSYTLLSQRLYRIL